MAVVAVAVVEVRAKEAAALALSLRVRVVMLRGLKKEVSFPTVAIPEHAAAATSGETTKGRNTRLERLDTVKEDDEDDDDQHGLIKCRVLQFSFLNLTIR